MEKEDKTLNIAGSEAESAEAAVNDAAETVAEKADAAVEGVTEAAAEAAEAAGVAAEAAADAGAAVAGTAGDIDTAAAEVAEAVIDGEEYEQVIVDGVAAVADVPKKKKTKVIVAAVIVVCLLIGVGAAYAAGLFTKPADQVLIAMDKTFVGDDFTTMIGDMSDEMKSGTYTADVSLGYIDGLAYISANMAYSQDREAGEQSLSGNLDLMGLSFTVNEYLNDSVMELSVPELMGDQTVSYPYTIEKSGYLAQVSGPDSLKQMDESLKAMYSAISMDTSGGNDKMKAAVREDFKSLAFKKAEKQEVEIDGAKVLCKGYTATIDKDFMNKIMDDFEEAYGGEDFEEYMDAMNSLSGMANQPTYSESISNIRKSLDDMKPFEVTFLLNKKKLAGILFHEVKEDASGNMDVSAMDSSSEMTGILFHKSDIPWHDTELVSAGSSTRLVVDVDGKKETMTLSAEGSDAMTFVYDGATGEFNLKAGDTSVEGTIEKTEDGISFDSTFDKGTFSLNVRKGADITRPANEFVLDMGTVTEEQYNDLMNTVSTNISAMLGF